MYMMNWTEGSGTIEASLGGRITPEELQVLAEELSEILSTLEEQPYLLLLDHSRAEVTWEAHAVLSEIKDFVLENSLGKVISVAKDEEDAAWHTNARLQHVLEGREQVVVAGKEIGLVAESAATAWAKAA